MVNLLQKFHPSLPICASTCCSFRDPMKTWCMWASVHRYDAEKKRMPTGSRAGWRVRCAASELEGRGPPTPGRANIWADLTGHKHGWPSSRIPSASSFSFKGQEVSHSSFISRTAARRFDIVGCPGLARILGTGRWRAKNCRRFMLSVPRRTGANPLSEIYHRLAGRSAAYVAEQLLAFRTVSAKHGHARHDRCNDNPMK